LHNGNPPSRQAGAATARVQSRSRLAALPRFIRREILLSLCLGFSLVCPGFGEFYRYQDADGNVHYVDDISKIPDSQQGEVRTYKEKFDHLPEDQKRYLKEDEDRRVQESEMERAERFRRLLLLQQQERAARLAQKQMVTAETPFTLQNNQVLVPATIGLSGREVAVNLLVDTGASVTSLHQNAAMQLDIQGARNVKAQVAGGSLIDARIARLDYIQVGPRRVDKIDVFIYDFVGEGADHDGLLGMNFLGHFQYSIDLPGRVIRWAPGP